MGTADWLLQSAVPFDFMDKDENICLYPADEVLEYVYMGLRIFMLGKFQVYRTDGPVPDAAWKLQKNKALLKILLTHRRRALGREQLLEWLWPDIEPESGDRNLRVAVSQLREALEPDLPRSAYSQYILTTDSGYAWNQRAEYWLDVDEFQHLADSMVLVALDELGVEITSQLKQTIRLYRGEYLEEDRYADWATAERDQLSELFLTLLGRLAGIYLKHRQYAEAAATCSQILAIDRCRESAWQQLMLCRYYAGDQAAGRRAYEDCRHALQTELELSPLPETDALYEKITRHVLPVPAVTIPQNLPHYLTTFIGRKNELAELTRLSGEPYDRLTVLVGMGGMGKTRLAVETGRQNLELFPQGVYFTSLETVDTYANLLSALFNALRLSFLLRDDPRTLLLDYLREKRLLLILDGFDSLLNETGLLVDILQNAPGVHFLVTSRQVLNLQSARTLELGGLDYADGSGTAADDHNDDAVQLFIERAGRVRSRFTRALAQERAFIQRICKLVDGMPLGIELAATWVGRLSCREIAEAIEADLDFLSTEMQDVPASHRGLRVVFDHSWNFLTAEDRQAFRYLEVFRGGFTREAGVEVGRIHATTLDMLVAKSLLHVDPSGRYWMHDLVRQYAADKLAETPDEFQLIHDRHCSYYAAFVRRHTRSLKGDKRFKVWEELSSEIDNLWSAWRWAYEHNKEAEIDQCLDGLYGFCAAQGHFLEGQDGFGRAAIRWRELDSSPAILGRLLARQGTFSERLGQYDEARRLLQEGLEIASNLGLDSERAFCLNSLGNLAYQEGNYAQASRIFQDGQKAAQISGAQPELVRSLFGVGLVAEAHGEMIAAKKIFNESLALAREMKDLQAVARSSGYLGLIASHLGMFAEAGTWCRSSLEAARQAGDRVMTALALDYLGHALLAEGEVDAAGQLYQDSLVIRREIGNRWGIAASLDNLGRAAAAQRDFEAALRWHQASLAISVEKNDWGSAARSWSDLTRVNIRRKNYPEAISNALQSLEINRESGHQAGMAVNLCYLAIAAAMTGEIKQAVVYLRQAIALDIEKRPSPVVLEILAAAAAVLSQQGRAPLAVELGTYVMKHPAATWEVRNYVQQFLSGLKADLPEVDFKVAGEHDSRMSFDEAWKIVIEIV